MQSVLNIMTMKGLNEVYSGYILYICSCGVWEIHMPSFEISIWSMRICLKITKMARQRRRPMSNGQTAMS